jgi:hypothetical protein
LKKKFFGEKIFKGGWGGLVMLESELLLNLAYLILAITPVLVLPKLINGSKHNKNAIFTPKDVDNLRKGHDLEIGYYKNTINRLRSQLAHIEKLPEGILDKAKATQSGNSPASAESIDQLADELLEKIPMKWRAIFSPIKSGIVKSLVEKEQKEPGAMLKAISGIAGRIGVANDKSGDTVDEGI